MHPFPKTSPDTSIPPIKRNSFRKTSHTNLSSNMSKPGSISTPSAYLRMIKNRKIKKNWSLDDLRMLVWIISAYCNIHGRKYSDLVRILVIQGERDWQEISAMIPGADGETIMFKWLGLRKNNLAMQQWREHQKSLLK